MKSIRPCYVCGRLTRKLDALPVCDLCLAGREVVATGGHFVGHHIEKHPVVTIQMVSSEKRTAVLVEALAGKETGHD